MSSWTLLGTPIYTLAGYKGMGESPEALRKAGLAYSVGAAHDSGDVEIPPLMKDVEDGRTKNLSHFRDATSSIFSAASSMDADRVMVVGGECSETIGVSAGLAEVFEGKPGMLWLDAHGDFNTPETSPSGYIGGMCLAMACGRARGLGLGVEDDRLSLGEERLVHMGSRALDLPELEAFSASPARLYTSQQVRKRGAAELADEVARHLDSRSDWIMCHFDVDVVDPTLIPAVNYPTPAGISMEEAATIIRKVDETKKLRAVEVAAYNPFKDKGGASARNIVELLKHSFIR